MQEWIVVNAIKNIKTSWTYFRCQDGNCHLFPMLFQFQSFLGIGCLDSKSFGIFLGNRHKVNRHECRYVKKRVVCVVVCVWYEYLFFSSRVGQRVPIPRNRDPQDRMHSTTEKNHHSTRYQESWKEGVILVDLVGFCAGLGNDKSNLEKLLTTHQTAGRSYQ